MSSNPNSKLYYEEETYAIIGVCLSVHKVLGHGFLEIVYKDAIEWELRKNGISYCREQEFKIDYKGTILLHKFYADFVIKNQIILEAKAAEDGIADVHTPQVINYLRVSGCKVGLLVNLGEPNLIIEDWCCDKVKFTGLSTLAKQAHGAARSDLRQVAFVRVSPCPPWLGKKSPPQRNVPRPPASR